MNITLPFDIDSPHGELSDVPCDFTVDAQTYIAEPYSHGGSRGDQVDIDACVTGARLGGVRVPRAALIEWMGADHVARLEQLAVEMIVEQGLAA
jgi:hypothetical protein